MANSSLVSVGFGTVTTWQKRYHKCDFRVVFIVLSVGLLLGNNTGMLLYPFIEFC